MHLFPIGRCGFAFFVFILSITISSAAISADYFESFTGGKLPAGWTTSFGDKSAGTATPGPDGIALQGEPRLHCLLRRDNDIVGTDVNPLNASVGIKVFQLGNDPISPGLFLTWDNGDFIGTRVTNDGHLLCYSMVGGKQNEQYAYHLAREFKTADNKKGREIYLRVMLISRNAAFYYSADGANWRRMFESNRRPGPGAAPKIVLGRGWQGDANGKPHFSNDYYPDGNKTLFKSVFSNFRLHDTVAQPGEFQAPAKQDTWELTLSSLEPAGVPRTWSFLGPLTAQDGNTKKLYSPDLSDDWSVPHKDSANNVIKSSAWTRKEDDNDCYVDLSEQLGQVSKALGWARTEIQWPVNGEALCWFSSGDPITIYVNNNQVYNDPDDQQYQRPAKDRACVRVALNKGKNVIKVRIRQVRGDWGFYLRFERNDPGYRIRLLESLLEMFPDQSASWRAVQARQEIARRYEDMNNFPAALAATEKALAEQAADDEARVQSFENKLRLLEFIRDYDGVVKACDDYLSKFPGMLGCSRARFMALRGEILAGKGNAAPERLKKYVAATDPQENITLYRVVSGAFDDLDDDARRVSALDELVDSKTIPVSDRLRAAIEAVVVRWESERRRSPNQPIDAAKLAPACKAAAKALSLIPSGKGPAVNAFVQEAENDLKAGKGERAVAGYWGALLLALCAADKDSASYLTLSNDYKIAVPDKDKDNKPYEDVNLFKRALWKSMGKQLGDPAWTDKWKFVGFNLDGKANIRTDFGPERESAKPDYGNGKKWVEMDLDNDPEPDVYRGNHDLGIDLKRWSGNSQVGYVTREFEVSKAGETFLHIGSVGPWFAWIDGKPVGENANVAGFRFEGDRVKLNLTPGKHRLLLKLEAPAENLPFAYRARISNEPELAVHLLVQALTVRQFPRTVWDRKRDLHWVYEFSWGKAPNPVCYTVANSIAQLFMDHYSSRIDSVYWTTERMRDGGEFGLASDIIRDLLPIIEASGWYPEKSRHFVEFSSKLFLCLVGEGNPGAADAVLRDVCNRYPDLGDPFFQAVTWRGSLRRDFGLSQTAIPFYEYVVRENPLAWKNQRAAVAGLDWARNYRPERLNFETSHEVQSSLDGIRRQLGAGNADDIERAMRNISETLSTSSGSLSKVIDSPFSSRYVGVREYVRALLASLSEDARNVYRKVVEPASNRRLKTASELNDVTALESLANEYYYTPAAFEARNRAGNLYLDRGQFAQAASIFQILLRESKTGDNASRAVVLAKLARALLADGQMAAGNAALERLRTEFGNEAFKLGSQAVTGRNVADRLKKLAARPGVTDKEGPTGATFMGNLHRTGAAPASIQEPGPVVWGQPLIPSASLERTRGVFELDVRSLTSYPVISDGKVFVSNLESVRAIDSNSGKVLWTRTWGSGEPLFKGLFNGYPLSCPTATSGKLYMRAQESGVVALRCYSAETGKLIWNTGAMPESKKLIWLSDPAIAYGLAIASFIDAGDMNVHGVAAVDAETGRLRWKTYLVTGNTGIKTNDQYSLSTLHLGPPAVESGEVYVHTGLSSAAALNAFSGEVKWATSFPRLQFGDRRGGLAWAGYDLRMSTIKVFARGPLSPIITDDSVLLAPKDGSGIMSLDRQSGQIRWHKTMLDARFIGGLINGTVLLCDDTVTAVDVNTGIIRWQYSQSDQSLFGQPMLAGDVLYLPTDHELQRLNVKTGRLIGTSSWDARIGPLANLVGQQDRIVGVNDGAVAAIGPTNVAAASLPLYEARELEAAGKLEEAAAKYVVLLESKDSAEVMQALLARIRILQRLNKRDEALAMIGKVVADTSERLTSFNGLWEVKAEVFARALKARLGEKAPDAPAPAGDINGILAYAWQLPGESSRLIVPDDGPRNCVLVHTGSDLYCVNIADRRDIFWRSYVGPGIRQVITSPRYVAALGEFRAVILDRATGELLSEIASPAQKKDKRRLESKAFEEVAISDEGFVAVSDNVMYGWELPSGQNLWSKRFNWGQRSVPGGLTIAGGKVLRIQGVKEDKRNETAMFYYDLKSGNELDALTLGGRSHAMQASFMPDGKRVLYRADANIVCADVAPPKKLWQIQLPRLETRRNPFEFEGDLIKYVGEQGGRWNVSWLNAENGQELKLLNPDNRNDARNRLQGNSFRVKGDFVNFEGEWYKTISRQKISGDKREVVWAINLPEASFRDHHLQAVFAASDRVYVIYVRSWGGYDHFVLRSIAWENGQVLADQRLPGTPIRLEDNSFQSSYFSRGNVLMYTAREGVFAFGSMPVGIQEAVNKLKQDAGAENETIDRRADARRALIGLEPVASMAFLAPLDARVDGDLSEWKSTDPIVLEAPANYVPLSNKAKFNGKDDLSARVYTAWNQDGLSIAVDVTDDVLVSAPPGSDLTTGDSLRVVVDSRADYGSTLNRNEDYVGSLAWVNGRSVLNHEFGAPEESTEEPKGHVIRAPNGKGYRYELNIPWPLIRKDPALRPGYIRELRVGVAVYDDDGEGVKGAVELGAGTTSAAYIPQWLCTMTLLDVSQEKIERYRKVIDLVPGSDEAFRFIELILLSKRGSKPAEDKAAELENFIKTHPNCRNTVRAVGLLRSVYMQLGDKNPNPRVVKLLQDAKAPAEMQQMIASTAFKVWVNPSAKKPPQVIMLQFLCDHGWRRVYWGNLAGAPCQGWGRDGTREMLPMGEMPRPGQWTELMVSPFDLGIEGFDIREMAFTTFGGAVNFDRASVTVGGKETVIIDDAFPQKLQFRGDRMVLVDQVKHDGAKSFMAESKERADNLFNGHLSIEGAPIMSFTGVAPAAQPPAAAANQELYRKVAQIIPDTPEGLTFLRRVLELNTGDGKERDQKSIQEFKAFLKANPVTPNTVQIMRHLYGWFQSTGEKEPLAKCDELMQELKIPRDIKRAFFSDYSAAWTEWHVLGGFAALGERRGVDTIMEPERNTDLTWKTVDGNGKEIGWKKITNAKDSKGKPNNDPFVDLRQHLAIKEFSSRGPYFAYAYTKFNSPSKRRALMMFGAQDMVSIWVNGKRVVTELETQAQKDREVVDIPLRSGENEILIKVGCPREQRLGFVFRLADGDGKAFTDITNE